MALEPEKLEVTVTLATYQDMRNMLNDERKLRKSLLEWVKKCQTIYKLILAYLKNPYFII